MKNKRNQDKMVFGTASTGTVKSVNLTGAVLVIQNLDAHVQKTLKK